MSTRTVRFPRWTVTIKHTSVCNASLHIISSKGWFAIKNILTIAGSDSSGGAGIQADIKTISAHGCFAMSVITAITAQNTCGVFGVENISSDMIKAQMDAIFTDIHVHAVKIGMVSVPDSISAIADKLTEHKPEIVVLDPVMVSKSGFNLLSPGAAAVLTKLLLPLSTIVTPNVPEAEILSEIKIKTEDDRKAAARKIHNSGARYVLIKGGHMENENASDLLFDGEDYFMFDKTRIKTKNTHGTGCTLSAAIASNLGLGMNVHDSVFNAKKYITTAILHSLEIGNGVGPTNHFYELYQKAGMLND